MDHYDAIIVGSGFGGSVTAYRLAEAGLRVCVLERGKPYPPGSFARSPAEMGKNFWDPSAGLYGLFNVWSFRHLEALVSSGLGGGSLIYANVLLRKDEKWFVRDDPHESWPIDRKTLDPHYDATERMLGATLYPYEEQTPKTVALRDAAAQLGLKWSLVPLAVTFADAGHKPTCGEPISEGHRNLHDRTRSTCRLCGECDIGCNYGSKNTVDYNYLSEAKRLGAEIRTLCEVKSFAPDGNGYTVQYVAHDPSRPAPTSPPCTTLTTDTLVLAAGTLGTTHLLLKNRAAFPGLSSTLGSHFCGNGDLLTFAVRANQTRDGVRGPRRIDGSYGPVITSAIRVPDAADGGTGRGFYVEDAGYPGFANWVLEAAGAFGFVERTLRFVWSRIKSTLGIARDTNLSAELAAILGPGALSSSSVPLLGMGRDVPDGHLRLDDGLLDSDWRMESSRSYFDRVRATMKDISRVWDARFEDNLIWHLNHRVITVHPLGGCPMGHTDRDGVVDATGQAFGHPNLYVVDGAMMPGPVGANPSLTIAALADLFADHMIARHAERRGTAVPKTAVP